MFQEFIGWNVISLEKYYDAQFKWNSELPSYKYSFGVWAKGEQEIVSFTFCYEGLNLMRIW